ncbi:HIT domain-containing protein [Micromonospora sp. SL1-18]|uniref:HIT domain-containing protein n=1 Tax=Micromonospora sp. SL1-18 TaxID=3399128 RepID=UPI003A4D5273
MTDDFYCDEALSGRTKVTVVMETEDVLAFEHTRPFWPVHIVVVPKRHVPSLVDLGEASEDLLYRVIEVVRQVAAEVEREHGACRVLTNLGRYQDSKHPHFHVCSGPLTSPGPGAMADRNQSTSRREGP